MTSASPLPGAAPPVRPVPQGVLLSLISDLQLANYLGMDDWAVLLRVTQLAVEAPDYPGCYHINARFVHIVEGVAGKAPGWKSKAKRSIEALCNKGMLYRELSRSLGDENGREHGRLWLIVVHPAVQWPPHIPVPQRYIAPDVVPHHPQVPPHFAGANFAHLPVAHLPGSHVPVAQLPGAHPSTGHTFPMQGHSQDPNRETWGPVMNEINISSIHEQLPRNEVSDRPLKGAASTPARPTMGGGQAVTPPVGPPADLLRHINWFGDPPQGDPLLVEMVIRALLRTRGRESVGAYLRGIIKRGDLQAYAARNGLLNVTTPTPPTHHDRMRALEEVLALDDAQFMCDHGMSAGRCRQCEAAGDALRRRSSSDSNRPESNTD